MLGLLWPVLALAQSQLPTRIWEFDLKTAGTYKLQVEHDAAGITPGTSVSYSIQIGTETRTRALDLIANRPFVPLIVDIPRPQKMQVTITGLTKQALQQTRVQVYGANSRPPGDYFDPEKSGDFKEAQHIRNILNQSADNLDLALVKLSIDKMIDSAVDVEANLKTIDAMIAGIKTMPEFGVSSVSRLRALQRYVYEPGGWNDHRPFQYDLDDPFGAKISNKLLSTYLESRKGNCVTMPFLFVVLGQRLGIEITASTAPKHLLVKWKNEVGTWINLEATSGANPARDTWIRGQMPMTDQAIANGIYLQPLTRKETVAVMVTTLAEYYLQRQEYQKVITLADITLDYYPKDVGTMTMKAVAYGRSVRKEFIEKYPSPSQIPANQRDYFEYLSQNNRLWFAKAEALGWREEPKEATEKYLQEVSRARKAKTAN